MEKITNEQQYYIKHFSQMTCMSFYFMSNNKQDLLNNKDLIDNYLHYASYENLKQVLEELKSKNITVLCDEYDEIDENMINNAICVEKYSYRF